MQSINTDQTLKEYEVWSAALVWNPAKKKYDFEKKNLLTTTLMTDNEARVNNDIQATKHTGYDVEFYEPKKEIDEII